jgi:hypothetical protein
MGQNGLKAYFLNRGKSTKLQNNLPLWDDLQLHNRDAQDNHPHSIGQLIVGKSYLQLVYMVKLPPLLYTNKLEMYC